MDLNLLLYLFLLLLLLGLFIHSVVRKRIDESRRRDEPDLSAGATDDPEEETGDKDG